MPLSFFFSYALSNFFVSSLLTFNFFLVSSYSSGLIISQSVKLPYQQFRKPLPLYYPAKSLLMGKRLVVASQMKATSKCIYPRCAVVTVANHGNQVVKVELKLKACYKLIQLCNCKKGTCGAKLLKIYVYLLLIWLAFITFVKLLATRFQPLIPLCILWLS